MKLFILCFVFSATIAVLSAASIQNEKKENEDQAAKKEVLMNKLRGLLKASLEKATDKEVRQEDDEANAETKEETAVGKASLQHKRGQQNPATSRLTRGKIAQLLKKRIQAPGARRTSNVNGYHQQTRRNTLRKKSGPVRRRVNRQSARGTRKNAPNRQRKVAAKRHQTLNKRQFGMYMSCEECFDILNYGDGDAWQNCYDQYGYPSYPDVSSFCGNPGHDYYDYDYGWYDYYPDYHYDSWIDYDYNYDYNDTCDSPCMNEYGEGAYVCFIAEVYNIMKEVKEEYMYMSENRFDDLECKLWRLLDEVYSKTTAELSSYDPNQDWYNWDYYNYYY